MGSLFSIASKGVSKLFDLSHEHEDVGYYTLPSGHVVHALCVYHPSAGYDWSYWHDVIEAMKEKINI